jgi:hypothetical protein
MVTLLVAKAMGAAQVVVTGKMCFFSFFLFLSFFLLFLLLFFFWFLCIALAIP